MRKDGRVDTLLFNDVGLRRLRILFCIPREARENGIKTHDYRENKNQEHRMCHACEPLVFLSDALSSSWIGSCAIIVGTVHVLVRKIP